MGTELAEMFAGIAGAVAIVGFLATVAEAIVEGLVSPIWKRYELDGFWLFYVAWAVAGGLVLLSGANLFDQIIPAESVALSWVGRALTAVVAGRGSNFLHDLFSVKRKQAELQGHSLANIDAGPVRFEWDKPGES